MSDDQVAVIERLGEAPSEEAPSDELAVEDVLVEEVSIDGMCGVY